MKSNRFIKRLDWYIIKKFLGTYVFAIALIISIAVVFDFNEKMDKLMEHEAPWSKIIFEYYMNFIPLLLQSVQSVVRVHCRHFLYLKTSGELRDYRHVLYRNEFQENDASLYDFCGHYRINDLYAKFVRNP